jgi:hypothetical protein
MKKFENVCAQGDILIRRIPTLPTGLKPVEATDGRIVVTHSETGHDHIMLLDRDKTPNVEMFQGENPLVAWLKVNRPTALKHLRPHDTHEPIMVGVGIYEIRRQREHSPEGWRRVAD